MERRDKSEVADAYKGRLVDKAVRPPLGLVEVCGRADRVAEAVEAVEVAEIGERVATAEPGVADGEEEWPAQVSRAEPLLQDLSHSTDI